MAALDADLTSSLDYNGYVSLADESATEPPEHVPDYVKAAFLEGAKCQAINCPNAAATMFRLCIDLATKPLLPDPSEETLQPNEKQRRDLSLRLRWLFEHNRLAADLRELATCVREDANDGAHAGTLTLEDAEDVQDFASVLLDRLFTEPARIRVAGERRAARRAPGR